MSQQEVEIKALKQFKKELINCLVDMISVSSGALDKVIESLSGAIFFSLGQVIEMMTYDEASQTLFIDIEDVRDEIPPQYHESFDSIMESEELQPFINADGVISLPLKEFKLLYPTACTRIEKACKNFLSVFHSVY